MSDRNAFGDGDASVKIQETPQIPTAFHQIEMLFGSLYSVSTPFLSNSMEEINRSTLLRKKNRGSVGYSDLRYANAMGNWRRVAHREMWEQSDHGAAAKST